VRLESRNNRVEGSLGPYGLTRGVRLFGTGLGLEGGSVCGG